MTLRSRFGNGVAARAWTDYRETPVESRGVAMTIQEVS
jgi:hypothetical protein